jgi:hypothetical protein
MNNTLTLILFVISAAFLLWFMFRTIRHNPHAFSKENLSKSIYTMGILALILIVIVFVCVWFLRTS